LLTWSKCWSTENLKDKFERIKDETVILGERFKTLMMQSGESQEKGQFRNVLNRSTLHSYNAMTDDDGLMET